MPGLCRRLAVMFVAGLMSSGASSAASISYPMTAAGWDGPKATFIASEVFPYGLMTVAEGYAVLKAGEFGDGTIEFDMKPLDYADTGILFHRRDTDTAEFVYVRADPDCPAANDCVQYAPVTNGRMQWNIYSEYQNSAPIADKGWNHLKLVVANGRLRMFVNRSPTPSIDVPHLQGVVDHGGLAVKGPAIFANLIVRPGDVDEPAPPAPQEPARPGTVHSLSLGPITPAHVQAPPTAADIPKAGWRAFETQSNGLVNLSRAIPRNTTGGLEVAWLKLTVDAATPGDRVIDLGFVPRVWLFLNGAPAYAGENFYYPDDMRVTAAGRFAPDNAKVILHLRKGRNVVVLAIDDAWRRPNGLISPDHYGWAAMVRFEDPAGLTIAP